MHTGFKSYIIIYTPKRKKFKCALIFRLIRISVDCELRDFFFLLGLLLIVSLQQFLIKNSSHSKNMGGKRRQENKIGTRVLQFVFWGHVEILKNKRVWKFSFLKLHFWFHLTFSKQLSLPLPTPPPPTPHNPLRKNLESSLFNTENHS